MTEAAVALGKGGLILLTLGLVIGFAIPKFSNSRMALSAHLTAVQTGPALIAVALFWPFLSVPSDRGTWLVGIFLLSSYLLVAGIALAAATGASSALPIAGKGYSASSIVERLVTVMVGAASITMLCAFGVLCWWALTGNG